MKLKLTSFALLALCSSLSFAQNLKNYQNPFSRYAVNPDTCIRIEHSSGSLIFIEANAIITESKKIDILYREYFTPLDMLAHGIRMHLQLGGDQFQLESSGMFEIYAVDGSDTLSFDPNKRMEVRLNGPKELKPGTEGYRYDPAKQQWDSYTSQITNRSVLPDDDLWGSSMVQDAQAVNELNDTFTSVVDTVSQKVFQSMEISDFGFYNYDRMLEGEDYLYLNAQFVSSKKEAIHSVIYVVYDNINSVFYYPETTWSDQFFLIKGKSYKLFTIAPDGKVLRLPTNPDLSKNQGNSYTFTLNSLPEIPKDRASFTKLTGIQ